VIREQSRLYKEYQQPCHEALYKIIDTMKAKMNLDNNIMAQRSLSEILHIEDQIKALILGVDVLTQTMATPTNTASFEFVEGEPVKYTVSQIEDIIKQAGQLVYIMLQQLIESHIIEPPDDFNFKEDFNFNGPVDLINKTRYLFKNINAMELMES
jgi:hypothetical protein